jgi:glycosyltransferase involved in cell wall biosynthesis
MNIYYYYPLTLHYNSGQTLQVIQDYKELSRHGHNVYLYGVYEDEEALNTILTDIKSDTVYIRHRKGSSKWLRNFLKCQMLWDILCDPNQKVIVSRNVNKMAEVRSLKCLFRRCRFLWERHEDAIPYLLKKSAGKGEKQQMQKLLDRIDGLILTNYSQQTLFDQEFTTLPPSIVLPNGVDITRYATAKPSQDKTKRWLTYAGQFTKWKNVELLFEALALLDSSFCLRLAGGKGDANSRQWVDAMAAKHGVTNRVDYIGFIKPSELPQRALHGSTALLLPLGDNMESRYFTSPMKLFEYMATSIPVISVDYPTIRGITGEDTVYLSQPTARDVADKIIQATGSYDTDRIAKMNQLAAKYTHQVRAQRFHAFTTGL